MILINAMAREAVRARKAREQSEARAARILRGTDVNPKQKALVLSVAARKHRYFSALCPRRAGKSFGVTSTALYFAEMYPESRILIISLTLKSTKANFWTSAPGGLHNQNAKYKLGLEFNQSDLTWKHQNGSWGRLAGAEDLAAIEQIRGAMAEADIIIIDECKSFSMALFKELFESVVEPGLMTRSGAVILCGTPGTIPTGLFYEATCPTALNAQGVPTCIAVGEEKPYEEIWEAHSWTIQDNGAMPKQWRNALQVKKMRGWADTDAIWQREYLGKWVFNIKDLVYAFAAFRDTSSWCPRDPATELSGKPEDWIRVMGIDFGFNDDTAITVVAWSTEHQELRQLYEFKAPHLTTDMLALEIEKAIAEVGRPSVMVADASGKQIIADLNARHSYGIVPAEKQKKFEYIELLNSDFSNGRVKILLGGETDSEMCGLQWDTSKGDVLTMARLGKLTEQKRCPNHLCDAFLYAWRYCYHFFSHIQTLDEDGNPITDDETPEMKEFRAFRDRKRTDRWEQARNDERAYYSRVALGMT